MKSPPKSVVCPMTAECFETLRSQMDGLLVEDSDFENGAAMNAILVALQQRELMREKLMNLHRWLTRMARDADKRAAVSNGRFQAFADACKDDAKNYRATADSIQSVLPE